MWGFQFLYKRREKKKKKTKHILCRHQKHDANVVKGLSVGSLVNSLSGMAKMFGSGFATKYCTLFLVASLLYLAPVGEEHNKNGEYREA